MYLLKDWQMQEKKVLLVDKRNHIGGNTMIIIMMTGFLFINMARIFFIRILKKYLNILSNFTEWRPYEHRVLASVDGMLVPIPINLNTINSLYGLQFELQ